MVVILKIYIAAFVTIASNDLACSLFLARRNLRLGSNFRLYSRMKKILFWFGVLVMSLLVMVQPAQASGTVASSFSYVYRWSSFVNTQASTWQGAANLACSIYYSSAANPVGACAVDAGSCNFTCSGGGGAQLVNLGGSASCPDNSTGTTICTCTDPYIPNAEATACVMPACPAADSLAGAYWITTGTTPDSIYTAGNGNFCSNGCQTYSFLSIPRPAGYPVEDGAYKVVAGVKTFYSFREYAYTGATCTGGDTLPVASTLPATDTCAPGQSMIQMGLKFRCIDPATGQTVDTNSASAVAAAKTLADAKVAAQLQAAVDAVTAAGGSASDVAAAQSVAAGAAAVAAGAPTDTGFAPDDPMNAFCVDNPQASICKDQTAGAKTVGTAALSGLYTDGALIGGKTVSSVVDGFKTRVLASGIGTGVAGFFTVNQAAGTCPVWSADVPMFGVMSFDFYCQPTFQNLLPWIRAVLLLIFSVVAFRIAVL